jgi:hypothetical protein
MHKLIQRMTNVNKYTELELYLLTFGISADPLTQFAMVLAALVHDGTFDTKPPKRCARMNDDVTSISRDHLFLSYLTVVHHSGTLGDHKRSIGRGGSGCCPKVQGTIRRGAELTLRELGVADAFPVQTPAISPLQH